MKKLFKFVFFVAFVALAFIIGSILGGDGFGIGKAVGLVDGNGQITDDSVNKFVDNTHEVINEGKDKVQEAIATATATATATPVPTPTSHPYTTVSEITISVGRNSYTFFSEPCETSADLEKKIVEAHTLNPGVKFVVDLRLASNDMASEVRTVVDNQKKANGIKAEYIEE